MKTRVLFLTGKLQPYRVPVLNLVQEQGNFDLTVGHSAESLAGDDTLFKEVILSENSLWRFTYHDRTFVDFCKGFDVVVCMMYLQKLSFMRLMFLRDRRFKLIYWGIGVKASQKSRFDAPTPLNFLRHAMAKRTDATILYSDYAREKYIEHGVDERKLFVMHNTVAVSNSPSERARRDRLLFVGTLNKSKKIFDLLQAYRDALEEREGLPPLDVVGAGADLESAREWVSKHGLEHKIVFHGAIFDEEILASFFNRALACMSPGQAGLSVLKSFGYGVPFITHRDAITGGERLNIDGQNGILFGSSDELKEIILDTHDHPERFLEMGKNAKAYYDEKRTPSIMAAGFVDAVNFVQG